jgi:hypothetical protein
VLRPAHCTRRDRDRASERASNCGTTVFTRQPRRETGSPIHDLARSALRTPAEDALLVLLEIQENTGP